MFPDLTTDDIFRIETKRLWLRWPRASDVASITSFASLAHVARMTALIPHPYAGTKVLAYLRNGFFSIL